jgi:hypothetical protein
MFKIWPENVQTTVKTFLLLHFSDMNTIYLQEDKVEENKTINITNRDTVFNQLK